MSLPVAPLLYALVSVVTVWLALLWLCPRRNKLSPHKRRVKAVAGAAALLVLFVPIDGVAAWNRAFSFHPNPSLPMLGIVGAALAARLFGFVVFQRADWRAIWIFGALGGSALYLHPMLPGAVDLYYWGWEREWSAAALGILAISFLALGNRLGVLLLGALVAYAFTALESRNCWDYVIDPFYWLTSLGALIAWGVEAGVRGRGQPSLAPLDENGAAGAPPTPGS